MTNEQVLVVFLKKHRKYTSFKAQQNLDEGTTHKVTEAINFNFIWMDTKEGQTYWEEMHPKWITLCINFKLSGDIDLSNL